MHKIQFIFDGGLGNQFFQFFASQYISRNFKNIRSSFALSKSILKGNRNFDLFKLIKEPIKINQAFKQFDERIYNKSLDYIPFLSKQYKDFLKYQINLFNGLYYEKKTDSFENPLSIFAKDLNLIQKNIFKLKVIGFWQNPSCYISDLNFYRNLLVDTTQFLPKNIMPNRYITIHVRRGDYLSKKEFNNYFLNFSPIKFILLSIQLLPNDVNNLPIYLISDDKDWSYIFKSFLPYDLEKKVNIIKTKDPFEDWSILRHSRVNICSNSTFSYTAALCNYNNSKEKLRCIIPQWFEKDVSTFEKGWLTPKGFIEI